MGCAARVPVPQTCPSRLLHPAQPSPTQLGELPRQPDCVGLRRPHPLSQPSAAERFRAQWTLWAFLSQHRPPALLPAEAWPCCVLLPRTLWILFALSLGRPGLVFGELFPAAAPAPHRFLLRPASSNHRLSKAPLHSRWLGLGERCLGAWRGGRHRNQRTRVRTLAPHFPGALVGQSCHNKAPQTGYMTPSLWMRLSKYPPFYKDSSHNA